MHPVLFDFGSITIFGHQIPIIIGTYGLFFLLAVLTGWAIVLHLGRKVYPEAPITDIYFGSVVAGFVGAKVANLIVFFPDIAAGRRSFVGVLMGGGVWLGGAIVGVAFAGFMIHRHKLNPGVFFNVVFTGIPLAHAVGRIACLMGGCCFGAACSMPWAITYTDPLAHRLNGTPLNIPLHPSPIYESLAEMMNFVICYSIWRRNPPPWTIFAVWTGLYGMERFFLEFFRGDPRGEYGVLTTSQWISAGMVLISVAAFAAIAMRRKTAA